MSRLVLLRSIVATIIRPDIQKDESTTNCDENEECIYEEETFSTTDFYIDNTSTNIDEFAQAIEDILKQNAGIA